MLNSKINHRKYKVVINTQTWRGKHTWFMWMFLNAMDRVSEIEVSESNEIPYQSIAVDGEVLAFIDKEDEWDSQRLEANKELKNLMLEVNPKIIFKVQYRNGHEYLPNTCSAGYFGRTWHVEQPIDLLTRERPYDIIARMRTNEYPHHNGELPFMRARKTIQKQAQVLEKEGLAVLTGFVFPDRYAMELYDTKIGFNWQGTGRLTFKMIEYLRAGCVPITQPLGKEWPFREDVFLEHEKHCIFCDRPDQFSKIAKQLLRDKTLIQRIRKNILELYKEKFTMSSMGHWYWHKLKEVVRETEM